MLKMLLGTMAVSVVLTQAVTAPALASSDMLERLMRKAERDAANRSTRAIVDRRGMFRVRGLLTDKSRDGLECTCTATFGHSNANFEFFSASASVAVVRGRCNVDVFFRWERADDTRPVFGNVNIFCQPPAAAGAGARSTSAPSQSRNLDLEDINPLGDNNSGDPPIRSFKADY